MAQVGVATGAQNLRPAHPKAVILVHGHVFPGDRLEEAGPAGAGVELRFRSEQRQPATNAIINAGLVLVIKRAAKRRSVPLPRAIWYWSAVSCARHSASVLTTFGIEESGPGRPLSSNNRSLHHSGRGLRSVLGCGRSWGLLRMRAATRHRCHQRQRQHELQTDHGRNITRDHGIFKRAKDRLSIDGGAGAGYCCQVMRQPPINVEEKIDRQVGRRIAPTDSLKAGMQLQAAAVELHKALRHRWAPKGVYRFKTHEEADEWMIQMLARSGPPET